MRDVTERVLRGETDDARVQVLRYLIAGGFGYVLGMSIYAALVVGGAPAYPAVVVAFVLNGLFNFAVLRRWAFPATGRSVQSEFVRFWLVASVTLGANYASFALVYSALGVPAVPAQGIAVVMATPVGFLANRRWSFGQV
ncbi:GtrA family protein [Conexibacter sp. SYSU D00693]|uniref:GtrA family protein n=1 Tax=Conexibacter sp. SYSU D00693 TaxID=2812560 RepID=UPI00196AB293|nr:GtrA family protein [Conexibacter sp. SYSU D00693]